MATNSFGNIFRITTWGESHGIAIGVVIDGCPAGVSLAADDLNCELSLRAPGNSIYTSPRKEKDHAEIYSGVFEGKTTGAPISIIIKNGDADSTKYEPVKNLLRPGHANFTYLQKYGIYDYRGGGRASARETACRVAAGAVAKKILSLCAVRTTAYIKAIGGINIDLTIPQNDLEYLKNQAAQSPIFCPDHSAAALMMDKISAAIDAGDSLGGIVEFAATGLPIGLGDPIYEKLEANLAKAMLSLPATKGFEIGEGFHAADLWGSAHNDAFIKLPLNLTQTQTNHAGGTLGGISTSMPLLGRVVFKPTASIKQPQQTTDLNGKPQILNLPKGSRHDPCVAIRAVPVVDAMCALVLVDALLMNRCVKI